jgi:peroxiredoxin (alkyl hydroperoxide reductase subunit C)
MCITIGQPAPTVAAEAWLPGSDAPVPVAIPASADDWTVLVFYPADFTFVCPTELRAFAELHDDFRAAGARIVAASTDSYWTHRAWFEADQRLAGVDYPVIADTAHHLSRAYGVLGDDGQALRGTFLIDPEGVVRHASVTDRSVGRRADESLRILSALRTGELCPVDWQPGRPTLGIAA